MMITTRTAKALCTKAELELVRASSARHVNRLTARQLNSKITRSRKLRDKYRDLANRQEREARGKQKAKSTRVSKGSERTRKKQQLFAETLERFQQQLKKLTASSKPAKKKAAKKKAAKTTARPKTSKSKAAKKKSPVKKGTKKTARKATKKAAKKTTNARSAKTSKSKKLSARKTKIPVSAKKAKTAAKKSRVDRSGRVRKTAHLSSTARRKQGSRNKTKR